MNNSSNTDLDKNFNETINQANEWANEEDLTKYSMLYDRTSSMTVPVHQRVRNILFDITYRATSLIINLVNRDTDIHIPLKEISDFCHSANERKSLDSYLNNSGKQSLSDKTNSIVRNCCSNTSTMEVSRFHPENRLHRTSGPNKLPMENNAFRLRMKQMERRQSLNPTLLRNLPAHKD